MAKQITVYRIEQWYKWLKKHHLTEEKVFLISYKKHTGKKFINHRAQMDEAICFGWIDTTVKKIDDDRYGRYFVKRKPSANWSKNTLSYGEKLLKEGRMSPHGKEVFLLGKKKKPLDYDIPEVLLVPKELKKALSKNKKAKETFDNYPPSAKKAHLKWLFRAKRDETRDKRIKQIVSAASQGKRVW